jgi:hypothetical protein
MHATAWSKKQASFSLRRLTSADDDLLTGLESAGEKRQHHDGSLFKFLGLVA